MHRKILATSSIEKDNPPITSNNTCLIEKNKYEEMQLELALAKISLTADCSLKERKSVGILFPLTQKYGKITSNKTCLIDHYQTP